MHISDMLGQYNRNVNNGTEELRSAQGVQKIVSTAGELSTGSVFEGTVNSVRGGKVTLALGNGQVILARLDGKVDLKPGTAMFFQVKSNDGSTVSIRPYNGVGNAGNPILLNALTAAQVPATERTLAMVDAMMQEQMPVDRQSILDMVKVINAYPEANVQTLVQMTKLGMPVNEEMAAQFEAYLSDRHILLNEMELAVGHMTEVLADEELSSEDSFALYSKLVDIFSGSSEAETDVQQNMGLQDATDVAEVNLAGTQAEKLQSMMADAGAKTEAILSDSMQRGAIWDAVQGDTLGSLLSTEQLEMLEKALQDIPTLIGNRTLFADEDAGEVFVDTIQDDLAVAADIQDNPETEAAEGNEETAVSAKQVLNRDMPVEQFMRALKSALGENSEYGFAGVKKLFAGREFQILLRDMVKQQWLIKPQDVKEEQKISKLYDKMDKQLQQLESAMKAAGITQNSLLQTTADIRGNIEFMNQMNQIYNYVQIPLQMSGQNANGELYVYTNRKASNDPEAELTAFLHLDMEHLGATDVSVRMRDKQVKTNFYFEDDTSYNLVEKHLPILEKHLKNKGYNCTITITNEKRNVNFKENFVKRGQVSAGSVHRYSFDVRA